jgi:hypothetical protein
MQVDQSRGTDAAAVGVLQGTHEAARWRADWRLDKYHGEVTAEDIAAGRAVPYESVPVPGNILLTAGITRLLNLLAGAGGTAFNATNTRIGVGNGNTAEAIGDTDLSAAAGAGNRQFKLVNGAPTVLTNTISWTAVFSTSQANFAWNEFGIDNGTADGTTVVAPLLNRKVSSLGTKTSAGTWTLTVTITLS